jgi:MFS family permease
VSDGNEARTLRRNIRELPRTAWFLIVGAFINRFASFALFFLVLYLTSHGVSVKAAGLAVAVWGGGEVLASLVGGHLADGIGRRNTIAVSMFSSAAAMMALSQVRTFGGVLPIGLVAGFASELYRPAGGALVADIVPEGQRVSAFALLRFAVNLAIAGGGAVAGILADHSFFWVFLSDAATSVAFGLIALAALPQGPRRGAVHEAPGASYRRALRDRAFELFLLSSIVAAFVYFQQNAALPLHVQDSGLSKADFGVLLSVNGLLVVLLELPISAFTMRRPIRQMLAVSYLLVGLGFGLTAVAHTLPALVATVAIWTLGEMVGAPVGYAYVADLAPENMRGRYQGLYGLCWSSGTVTAPAIGAYLVTRSPGGFWLACGLLGVLAAMLMLGSSPPGRHVRRVRDAVPEPVGTGPGLEP